MTIQWYPGHMHKAQKQMAETLPLVDLVIEVLDARIPFSSENPAIAQLRHRDGAVKPCIKVLNKSDLADPAITQQWVESLEKERGVKALALSCEQASQAQKIIRLARALFPDRLEKDKIIHSMIMGIPNAGKSTLINALAGRSIAKVGNEPAVTKRQQRIVLDQGLVLSDTPGILWPKVENENSRYRLAATGAIKDTAMEYADVAHFVAEYLLQAYPQMLLQRYQLETLPPYPLELLETIGRQRGSLRAGGKVDLNKVSATLVHELRAGTLGRISLETPQMIEQELIETAAAQARKEAEKAERKKAFKNKKR